MSERNNVLILLAVIVAIGFFAQAMQIFQGTDTTTITVSLNNTGNLDTPVQSITYISQSRADIKSILDAHILSGYSEPRYFYNNTYFSNKVPITLSHTGALTDHQTKLIIPYVSGMQEDFGDIVFTIDTGAHIPYWIESKTDSSTADVWTKNDYLDGDTDIWMYYGNSGLSSGSSGDDTFIQWRGSETNQYLESLELTNNFIHEIRIKMTSPGFGIQSSITNLIGNSDDFYYSYIHSSLGNIYSVANEGTSSADGWQSPIFVVGEYHTLKTAVSGSGVKFYRDGIIEGSELTTNLPDENLGMGVRVVTGTYEQDFAFVRKYTATEPTNTIGAPSSSSIIITPSQITLNSIQNNTGTYGSYPIIPANTEQDFILNGTQNFNYTIDFTPTDLTVTTSSSVLYADRAHTFNAIVSDHNTGTVMPTQPDKVKYRLVGSGNTSVSAKEFVGTSLTLPALQKGTYTLFTSVGWNNIPTWSNEISQSVILTDAATPAQAVALSVVEALTDTTTDTTNETTKDILVGVPGRIADGWKSMLDDIITFIKNIIHDVSAVFS